VGTGHQIERIGRTSVGSGPYDLSPLAVSIDVQQLSSHLTEVMLDEVYSHVIDPDLLRPLLIPATAEKLACLSDLIAGRITLDEIHAPAALAFAEEVGRQGISEQTLERSYRVGIEALWDWWMSVVEQHCEQTGDPVVEVVRTSIPVLFGFVDRMLFVALAAYHRAVSQRSRTREYRRIQLVDQLLDGTLTDPGIDAERFIGYSFAQHHLAAVLVDGDRAEDRKFAAELKSAARAAELLVLEPGAAPSELWLGFSTQLTGGMRSALASQAAAAGRRLAFGEPAQGLRGFRVTMNSARNAAKIQAMLADHAPQMAWAEDLGIEILALDNPDATRAFVNSVLGTALDHGLLTSRARETLDAWLVSGSYVGAASLLGVHEQTVRQRLHRLEEALGHSVHARRTELHVALRLSLLTLPPGSVDRHTDLAVAAGRSPRAS
jgi:hypothetical protein